MYVCIYIIHMYMYIYVCATGTDVLSKESGTRTNRRLAASCSSSPSSSSARFKRASKCTIKSTIDACHPAVSICTFVLVKHVVLY